MDAIILMEDMTVTTVHWQPSIPLIPADCARQV